jgi:hypothetical protein
MIVFDKTKIGGETQPYSGRSHPLFLCFINLFGTSAPSHLSGVAIPGIMK